MLIIFLNMNLQCNLTLVLVLILCDSYGHIFEAMSASHGVVLTYSSVAIFNMVGFAAISIVNYFEFVILGRYFSSKPKKKRQVQD